MEEKICDVPPVVPAVGASVEIKDLTGKGEVTIVKVDDVSLTEGLFHGTFRDAEGGEQEDTFPLEDIIKVVKA